MKPENYFSRLIPHLSNSVFIDFPVSCRNIKYIFLNEARIKEKTNLVGSPGKPDEETFPYTAVSRKGLVRKKHKSLHGIMVNCQFESAKTWRQCYRKHHLEIHANAVTDI